MASVSEADKPSVSNAEENRSRLCDEFAAIAGTDSAVAQCYLAENDWEMEVTLQRTSQSNFNPFCSIT